MDSVKNKLRKTRLRWYGYIFRRENSYVGKNNDCRAYQTKENLEDQKGGP